MNYLNIILWFFTFIGCVIINREFNGISSSGSTKGNFIGHKNKEEDLRCEFDIKNLKFKRYYIHIL
jgi:hypothetical protein